MQLLSNNYQLLTSLTGKVMKVNNGSNFIQSVFRPLRGGLLKKGLQLFDFESSSGYFWSQSNLLSCIIYLKACLLFWNKCLVKRQKIDPLKLILQKYYFAAGRALGFILRRRTRVHNGPRKRLLVSVHSPASGRLVINIIFWGQISLTKLIRISV